jgi:hypothetical protein
MNKLFRIVSISKDDGYHADRRLIGAVGTMYGMSESKKGYVSGQFIKLYRNTKDLGVSSSHFFYAVKVMEMVSESQAGKI